MANPTNPFNWQMPQSTDLVTDLPADFETFGQAVATSMADLLGGTTGQVLAKASNTDMDFTWVAQDDSNAIQNAIVDAKGDLIGATAADTPARLAVGANGTILVANSAESTGLKWTTATDQFPWQAWTPTYTNLTIGNGSVVARYQQIGKTVNFEFYFTMGSTSSMGSTPTITMPVTPKYYAKGFDMYIQDFGTQLFWGMADTFDSKFYPTATLVNGTYAQINYLSSTVPMTWTTSDNFSIRGSYEAA